jgi:hypothetical protein
MRDPEMCFELTNPLGMGWTMTAYYFRNDYMGVEQYSRILLSMHNQADAAKILRDAAHVYRVDLDAISATVKQEFVAKDKGKANKKATPKSAPKPAKKAAA